MIRVANVVEKNTVPAPAKPVTVAAGVSTIVLPDISQSKEEFIGRYVFNDSGTVAYYAFGQDADNAESYHGKLADQQQLDCSNIASRVSIYSIAGGKFVPTILRRQDLIQHQTIFQNNVPSYAESELLIAPTITVDSSSDSNIVSLVFDGASYPNPEAWVLVKVVTGLAAPYTTYLGKVSGEKRVITVPLVGGVTGCKVIGVRDGGFPVTKASNTFTIA